MRHRRPFRSNAWARRLPPIGRGQPIGPRSSASASSVLAPALHGDTDFRRRLEQEARAASSLNHPNIVTVYEIGQAGAIDFVASELVDGVTVRERLAAGPMPLREIVDVVGQVATA